MEENPGNFPEYFVMVQTIINDFETIIEKLNSSAHKMQNPLNDEVSAGMFYGFMGKYQKTVWMLRSLLEK